MMFRFAGLTGVLLLLIVNVMPASAQAAISIGEWGTLSNGRYTATVDVGFTCEHPGSYGYGITVRVVQTTGRSWSEGVTQFQGFCVADEAVYLSVVVDTLAAAYRPGPATVTVDLERRFQDEFGYDWDTSQATGTVKFKGGDSGSPPPSQAIIFIGDRGTLSNGRQTATVDVGFTCEHPGAFGYGITVRVVQPSGQSQAEGVYYSESSCVGGEAVNASISVNTTTTAFKPGPATVIVDLERRFQDDFGYDWDTSQASATVKFKGK